MQIKNGLLAAVAGITLLLFILYQLELRKTDHLRNKVAGLETKVTVLKGVATAIETPDSVESEIDTVYLEGKPIPVEDIPDISFNFKTGGNKIFLLDMMKSPHLVIDTTFTDDNRITTELDLLINRFSGEYEIRIKTIPPGCPKRKWFGGISMGYTSKDSPLITGDISYRKFGVQVMGKNDEWGALLRMNF